VTYAAGVPTVWQMLLNHMKAGGLRFSPLKRTVIGGSACPPAMITCLQRRVRRVGAARLGHDRDEPAGHAVHAQEQAPQALPREEQMKIRLKQGRAIYGVDMKIVDDDGQELPWDGKTYGDLWSRGPGSCAEYFKGEAAAP
jgi:acyl-CoA synthetase (AMP-forming)/AMP-acid ligase II